MRPNEILMNHYKLLEKRCNYFNQLFWQIPLFLFFVMGIVIGGVVDKSSFIIRIAYIFSGGVMGLTTCILYCFFVSQDDLENRMAIIEAKLKKNDFLKKVQFQYSYGRRRAKILTICILEILTLIFLMAGLIV